MIAQRDMVCQMAEMFPRGTWEHQIKFLKVALKYFFA